MRGQPREAVKEAAHQAVRDAIFLVELVLRLNGLAEEMTRIEGLRYAVLFWEMRAISAEAELARRSRSRAGRERSSLVERWQAWRVTTTGLLIGICAAEEARMLLERRYLDGHPALFPDAIADWQRLRDSVERLASLGDALRPLMEGRRRTPRSAKTRDPDPDLVALRAAARSMAPAVATRLVDEARVATLDVLGDAGAPPRSRPDGCERVPEPWREPAAAGGMPIPRLCGCDWREPFESRGDRWHFSSSPARRTLARPTGGSDARPANGRRDRAEPLARPTRGMSS
jgi:hypothetical protein